MSARSEMHRMQGREGSAKLKGSDPDKGPPMLEGKHSFDKGYDSDEETFSPRGMYPGSKERGNPYFKLQNEAVRKDSTKLFRSKFTKIA